MGKKIETDVQQLLETNAAVLAAENAGNSEDVHKLLKAGMSTSCDLLRFMVSDSLLNSAHPKPDAWRVFQKLAREDKLHTFLDAERRILLKFTDLKADIVEIMVGALRRAIEIMIEKQGRVDASWVLELNKLANSVCQRAATPAVAHDWKRFLKRAALAGAGGVVMAIDLIAMAEPKWQALKPTLEYSVGAGSWLISWAAAGELDDWFDSKRQKSAGGAA